MEKYLNKHQIKNHKLANKKLANAGIELLAEDEIFVQYPKQKDYYGSNYGRLISTKYNKVELLPPSDTDGYANYKLSQTVKGKAQVLTISSHRLVADIFLPNFWKDRNRNQLQAHHLDHSKRNNYYRNLLFLPTNLHTIMNHVESMCIVVGEKAVPIVTPYDLLDENITLDEIIALAQTRAKKRVTLDGYDIYTLKGLEIGFKFVKKPEKQSVPDAQN